MTDAKLLAEALGLKAVERAGWRRVGVPHPESVAAHSWGVALAAMLRCPPNLDREKVLVMAILHDLGEVRIGDITPHDGISREEKKQRELQAVRSMLTDHPRFFAIWLESEALQTAEAKFVKSMDRLDMGVQAEAYARQGFDTSEFLAATTHERKQYGTD